MKNQNTIKDVHVQPVVFKLIAEKNLTTLPVHRTHRIQAGELFCFKTWQEECLADTDEFIYVRAIAVGYFASGQTLSDRVNYELVRFRVIANLGDVVIL